MQCHVDFPRYCSKNSKVLADRGVQSELGSPLDWGPRLGPGSESTFWGTLRLHVFSPLKFCLYIIVHYCTLSSSRQHLSYGDCRPPRSKKWNIRTKFLDNFRTISGHFCRFHEARDTENVSVGAEVMSSGKLFQRRLPATGNAQSDWLLPVKL